MEAKADKEVQYVNKANQRFTEFKQFVFLACKGIAYLDSSNINLFRVRNYIKEKRWSSLASMKNAFIPKGEDWLIVYECDGANNCKYVVVIVDPIELWEDPYTIIAETM
ncbi:MAG: hypothetical protein WDO71_22620 [Bacteroidota bacterium]